MKRHRPRNVMVAYPIAVPWMALFVCGVADYAKRHGDWNLTTSPPTLSGATEVAQSIHNLRGWPGDGVIAAVRNPSEVRIARRLGIPVVNISGIMQKAVLPRVMLDNCAIGRLAAEHLLERGHRRLAYYGIQGLWYSEQRRSGFAQRAEQAGVCCEVFDTAIPADSRAPWQKQTAPLARWLRSLKTPVGMLAVQDYRARIVLDECLRLGLHVPHDVSILGIDNDQTTCEFSRPTLSSVSRNAWRMGCEAAELLDLLMAGKTPPAHDILIPPDGIVVRQSTDTVAFDDQHIAAAVHFMRDHVAESFNVATLMQHVSISRRQLELRFRRVLDCSPLEYLCLIRVERAKELLGGPQRFKLRAVATACGFPNEERLRLVFRRVTGMTPQSYRQICDVRNKAAGSES